MFNLRRMTSVVALLTMTISIVSTSYPAYAGPDAAEDLKQIEYRYYFRGRYPQAITALQTYLARVDLGPAETTHAREVLAASYVLGGAPAMGQGVFAQIIAANPGYAGPDPSVFKLEVMNTYAEARAAYAASTLKTATVDPSLAAATKEPGQDEEKKPIYKKWWLYAGVAVVALVAGVAVGGGDDGGPTDDTGTVVVGVRIQ